MKTNTQSIFRALNAIKHVKAMDARINDKYSGMFLLRNMTNGQWVKGEDWTSSKALATRFTYEGAKKKRDASGIMLAIVDEHTDEIITDSCDETSTCDELTIEEIDELILEEEEAIASYDEAIKNCKSETAKATLIHIRDEEKEHVEELKELRRLKEKGVHNLGEVTDAPSGFLYPALEKKGYKKEQISKMTPEEAHRILAGGSGVGGKGSTGKEESKKDLFSEQKEGTWTKISKRQLEEKIKLSEEDKSKLRKQGFLQNYHGYDIEQGNNEDTFYVYKHTSKHPKSVEQSIKSHKDDIESAVKSLQDWERLKMNTTKQSTPEFQKEKERLGKEISNHAIKLLKEHDIDVEGTSNVGFTLNLNKEEEQKVVKLLEGLDYDKDVIHTCFLRNLIDKSKPSALHLGTFFSLLKNRL